MEQAFAIFQIKVRKKNKKKEETPASAAVERDETRRGLQESICQWRLADRDAEPVSSLPVLSLSRSSNIYSFSDRHQLHPTIHHHRAKR
jgi:hypothetical protein